MTFATRFRILILLLLLLVTLTNCNFGNDASEPVVQQPTPTPVEPSPVPPPTATPVPSPVPGLGANGAVVAEVFNQVAPAVVRIQLRNGLGSGFLIDDQGHIVTNNHVVEGQSRVRVLFTGLFETQGRVVGTDPDSDLAVIQVDAVPPGVEPVPLGDSDELQVGQLTIAIGNPLGQDRTVTTGIISALGRTLAETPAGFSIGGIVQTDAAINPGNSGGPLLNAQGEVIGVNTAIATIPNQFGGSQASQGIGFAVPINLVKRVAPALIEQGRYEHPYLGIGIGEPITTLIAEQEGLPAAGIPISPNDPDGPTARAGLREQVILTAVDGQEVTSGDDLISYLELQKQPGDTVTLTVVNAQGAQSDIQVELGARPGSTARERSRSPFP
jgi:2-alkenal reductase